MPADALVIGIDLGGTKITTGLVERSGRLLARDYRETLAVHGPDAVIARMLDAVHTVLALSLIHI